MEKTKGKLANYSLHEVKEKEMKENDNVLNGKRSSNIELLRIILMFLLVCSHYVHNSGLLDVLYNAPLNIKPVLMFIFGMWGKPVINCFVLITGYFMYSSSISIEKYVKLLLEVEFYNVGIWLIFVIMGKETFTLLTLIKVIFPLTSISRNFVSCYLVFYLFIPFINILIEHINEKQHLCLLGGMLCVYTVLGTVPRFDVEMNYVSWFFVLYLIASYIRKYARAFFRKKKLWVLLFFLTYLLCIVSIIVGAYFSKTLNMRLAYYLIEDSNKPLALLLSLSLFVVFINIDIKDSKLINTLAKTTFGILLIHANSDVMRNWLWVNTFCCVEQYHLNHWLLLAICSVIIVFLVCAIIDLLRIYFLEKPVLAILFKKNPRKG